MYIQIYILNVLNVRDVQLSWDIQFSSLESQPELVLNNVRMLNNWFIYKQILGKHVISLKSNVKTFTSFKFKNLRCLPRCYV